MTALTAHYMSCVFIILAPIICQGTITITTSRSTAQTLKEHASLTLECVSTTGHATWKQNNKPVYNSTGRFVITEERRAGDEIVSRLQIVSAEPEDEGKYECSCDHSAASDAINVTVTGHEDHDEVSIDGPKILEKTLGSYLPLKCRADIHSKVEWLFNGQRISPSAKDEITTETDEKSHKVTVELYRTRLAREDFGDYSCQNVRDANDKATVTVQMTPEQGGGSSSLIPAIGLFLIVPGIWIIAH